MAPRETTSLLSPSEHSLSVLEHWAKKPIDKEVEAMLAAGYTEAEIRRERTKRNLVKCAVLLIVLAIMIAVAVQRKRERNRLPTGEYQLVERQEGNDFFKFYSFYDGPDSLGSAGFNTYVGKERALQLGIANVTAEEGKEFVYLGSKPTLEGPRESIRLEGNRRYQHGLFVLDLDHMPAGCGVWPAFWMTDEENWPDHGEIDVVEGINRQPMVKTALHTSDKCSMYAHVPTYAKTGHWDTATGIPDTWTGEPNYETRLEADNCWVMAPHQWANQGCVAVDARNNSLGAPLNAAGGGVYALEWDPANHRIRSWAFPRSEGIPDNLLDAMETASLQDEDEEAVIAPDTDQWGLPYAYFAIGDTTGCSADHFQDMRLVINLAFCGTVAGNRFLMDCPELANLNLTAPEDAGDPWKTCNAFIESNPKILEEAYWKIRGAYVYQRSAVAGSP